MAERIMFTNIMKNVY